MGLGLQAEFETIAQGALSPPSGSPATVRILRNQGEFQAFWQELFAGQTPPPPIPPVAFPDKMVIAVVDTVRPTGGYTIAITAVQPTDQGVFFNVVQTSPGSSCAVTQAPTQPYHLVTTSWTPGNPAPVLITSTQDCNP